MPVLDTKQIETKLPPPVRAGIGLVAAGVEKARHVDVAGIATLPLRGLGVIVNARNKVERTYEELSNRGETLLARWRGRPEPRQNTEVPGTAGEQVTETVATVAEVVDPFGLPEEVAVEVQDAAPGATLAHDELPLPDYDHLTLGSLRARLAKLDAVSLVQIRDYERAHANRLPVITMLENRIAKVATQA